MHYTSQYNAKRKKIGADFMYAVEETCFRKYMYQLNCRHAISSLNLEGHYLSFWSDYVRYIYVCTHDYLKSRNVKNRICDA